MIHQHYYFTIDDNNSIVYCDGGSMGSLISIENLIDPHDQKLLRGHDMQV